MLRNEKETIGTEAYIVHEVAQGKWVGLMSREEPLLSFGLKRTLQFYPEIHGSCV